MKKYFSKSGCWFEYDCDMRQWLALYANDGDVTIGFRIIKLKI